MRGTILLSLVALVLALHVACIPDAPEFSDYDGDGHDEHDCNDQDPSIHPGATEVCDGVDNDCDGDVDEGVTTTVYADSDLDGYGWVYNRDEVCTPSADQVEDSSDCDDSDEYVYPGARESCDGKDNDCDGLVDEDVTTTFYRDRDGDGHGDPDSPVEACDDSEDWLVDNNTDCDDSDASISPDADEVCDGIDNDCDGDVDEEGADAATWYADADGDGYGDDSSTLVQCEEPTGYSLVGGDCDDTDADINPEADELCDDGVDNDCDGLTDDPTAVDAATWYLDADGDGFGDASSTTLSCDEVGGYADNAEDCDDTDDEVHPDADEVCDDGVDNDCDGATDDSTAIDAVVYYADADGDGYGDASSTLPVCETNVPSGFVSDDADCDDTDSDIYPGALEYCDGVDEDCDGEADNDPEDGDTYYADADGDGYGDASESLVECSVPTGYVTDSSDCDDTDADLNPDTIWYDDDDLDGYGDSSSTTTQCANPGGAGSASYVLVDGDCDDADASIYPGAEEVCVSGCAEDGVDDDCDGTLDEGCPEIHSGTISSDETWSSSDDHYVACDVYVQGTASPVLTIDDGVSVEFASGTGLWVGWSGYGDVDIAGTPTGVEFSASGGISGDYDGLLVGQLATGSTVEGLAITDAGGNVAFPAAIYVYRGDVEIVDSLVDTSAGYGIYANSSEVLIEGTTVQDSADTGIYCTGGGLDPDDASFVDNVLTGNDGYPIVVRADEVSSLDASSTFTGNTDDRVQVLAGTVTETTSWQDLGAPYLVDGTVYVRASATSPTLTLEDGVELQFEAGTGLVVGHGTDGDLVVQGTADGVLMTSAEDVADRAAGDWHGLVLGSSASSSSDIDGLTLEYAGGSSTFPGGLYLGNPDPLDITDSTFQDNDNSGVYINAIGGASFEECTFEDNAAYGLYLVDGARLEGDFLDNTLTGNGAYPVSIPASYLGRLDPSSTFVGNTEDYIRVSHDTFVDADATWSAHDVPYHVVERVYVGDSSSPVVTVEDDSEWYFDSGTGLLVGHTYAGDLVVDGDGTDGVRVLFSAYDSTTPGAWDGIAFLSNTTGLSSLAGFELEYAGASSSYQGGLYVYHTELPLTDCVIADNSRWGIYGADDADLEVSDCTIEGTEASSLSSDGDGVYLDSDATLTAWSGNTVTGNDRYPVQLPASEVAVLDDASTYAGNGTGYDYVYTTGGSVTESGTWEDLDVPYLVDGNVTIQQSSGATTSPVLTVEDAEVYVGLGHYWHVGQSYDGDLVVDGALFTSEQDISGSTPAAGDWGGIWIGYYSSSSTSITGSEVHYAGGSSSFPGAVYAYVNGTTAAITGNDIANSQRYGIYCASATSCASMSISGNTASGTNTSGNTNALCPGW